MSDTDEQDFAEGAIVRIYLENFVTYNDLEFRPGNRLNVIIGPNGSGKSTIVCGICLVLGGRPNILGRATTAAEFIKNGCTKAVIEVELHNPAAENYIVRREITNTTSVWSINRKQASQKMVEQLTAKLGIQVGNLCQFLPQDKVCDFAKMSPQELLESTEKSINPELHEDHQHLKAYRQIQRTMEGDLARCQENLAREMGLNTALEGDVQNFKVRQKQMERLDILKKKRCWIDYGLSRTAYAKAKDERKQIQTELNALKVQHEPLRRKHQQKNQEAQRLQTQIQESAQSMRTAEENMNKTQRNIENLNDKIQEADERLQSQRQDEENRRRKVLDFSDQISVLKENLQRSNSNQDLQPEIDRVMMLIKTTNQELSNVETEANEIRRAKVEKERAIRENEEQLRRLKDIGNQRLEMLRAKHQETYKAVEWLRYNLHQFEATVHEPMLLSINCKDPKFAKYVESRISWNDMRAFLCENRRDMNKFVLLVREQLGLRINVVLVPNQDSSTFQPQRPIGYYGKYGFYSYLRELFTCPEAVMRYLCQMYRVHMIPVGNAATKDRMEEVTRECPELMHMYTENNEFVMRKSKYSDTVSSKCSLLRKSELFNASCDVEHLKQIEQQVQAIRGEVGDMTNHYKVLQEKFTRHEQTLNELRAEKKALSDKKNEKVQLMNKIKTKEDSLKRLESEKIDLDVAETEARDKKNAILSKKLQLVNEYKTSYEKLSESQQKKAILVLSRIGLLKDIEDIEKELEQRVSNLHEIEVKWRASEVEVNELKQIATKKFQEACKATNTGQHETLSKSYEEKFLSLPSTLEDVDADIHDVQTRLECTSAVDARVLEEYEARKLNIDKIERDISAFNLNLDRHRTNTEATRERWLTSMSHLINKINSNFSAFFSMIDCAGEVDLSVPENEDDFEKYGMRVKVKFRDTEELHELNQFHQSGGERSVSTILYIMSLLELTSCPFRCVDEINQGMDPTNERLVFEIIVDAMKRHNSQYFLLTPKMIRDLNTETACYWTLLSTVGSTVDSSKVRAELRSCRCRAAQLTATSKSALVPHLKGRIHAREEVEEYMKLTNDFECCVEMLQHLLTRSLRLFFCFPIETGKLISTGISEVGNVKATSTINITSNSSSDLMSNTQELIDIQQEITNLGSLLSNIHNMVDIKPWEMEPDAAILQRLAETNKPNKPTKPQASTRPNDTHVAVYKGLFKNKKRVACMVLSALLIIAVVLTVALVVSFKVKK